jgi:hypothetical protein
MEAKHISIIMGAIVLGVIGFYIVQHIATTTAPAPSIDDQLNALR